MGSQQAAKRRDANVKRLARQNETGNRATLEQYNQLGHYVGRVNDLEQDLGLSKAKVKATTQALAQAQSDAQQLVLALEAAQRHSLVEVQSPRLRAVTVASFIGRLLQARSGLWESIVRNLYLGMRIVGVLVWMLPTTDRARWKNESYNNLEELKQEGSPLLGDAFRIAARTPWLAVVLWAGAWRRSPAARSLPRLKPLWIGVGTAAATYLSGAAGIGQSPTESQMRSLVAASLLFGAVAVTGSYTGKRRPRRHRRKRRR